MEAEDADELHLNERDEIFPVGEKNHVAVQLDRTEDEYGSIRSRAIYVNHVG